MRLTRYSERLKMRVIDCEEKILEDFERESALLQYNKFIETRYPQTSPRGSLSPRPAKRPMPKSPQTRSTTGTSFYKKNGLLWPTRRKCVKRQKKRGRKFESLYTAPSERCAATDHITLVEHPSLHHCNTASYIQRCDYITHSRNCKLKYYLSTKVTVRGKFQVRRGLVWKRRC